MWSSGYSDMSMVSHDRRYPFVTLPCYSTYVPWDQYLCSMLYNICAKYRDMVPKAKADLSGTCWGRPAEAQVHLTNRPRPWVPCLGIYTDLKFVLQHTVFNFQFLCGSGWEPCISGLPHYSTGPLSDLRYCIVGRREHTGRETVYATIPSAIVHCHQNEAAHRTIQSPSMLYMG